MGASSARAVGSTSGVLQLLDGTDLDDSDARRWESRGDRTRLVYVLCLDEEESAKLLLRLGEGAVGRGHLAAADPDGPGGPRALQRVRDDVVTAAPKLVGVVEGRVDEGLHLALGHRVEHTLVMVDHEHEPHCILLMDEAP